MRRLYLVRHGEAVSDSVDAARPLSQEGRRETSLLAAYLKRQKIMAPEIWHSSKLRARQTAEIIAGYLINEKGKLLEQEGLRPDDPVGPIQEKIELWMAEREGTLMVVGHLPFLPSLAGSLLNGRRVTHPLMLPTAASVCLTSSGYGDWTMQGLIDPHNL